MEMKKIIALLYGTPIESRRLTMQRTIDDKYRDIAYIGYASVG